MHVWTLGEFLVPPKIGAQTELLSRTGLPGHMGNNVGNIRLANTIQHFHVQYHSNMVGHDSGGQEGDHDRMLEAIWHCLG